MDNQREQIWREFATHMLAANMALLKLLNLPPQSMAKIAYPPAWNPESTDNKVTA